MAFARLRRVGDSLVSMRTFGALAGVTRQAHVQKKLAAVTSRRKLHCSAAALKVIPFNLADIGEAIAEVQLVSWSVEEGDEVEMFDQICVVESDKATVPITSRYDGKIVKLYYEEGDTAKTGEPLVDIDVEDDSVDEDEDGVGPATGERVDEAKEAEAVQEQVVESGRKNKYPMTPAVRRIIKEHNLDAGAIPPTGKNGRVLKEDVLAYLEGGMQATAPPRSTSALTAATLPTPVSAPVALPTPIAAAPASAPVTVPGRMARDEVVPVQGMQRHMVKSMNAANSVPHFGYSDECVITNLVDTRAQLRPVAAARGVRLSYMPFIMKAASLALLEFPMLNSHVNEDCTEVIHKASHNISLAMQTSEGLLVPNVKDCQDKSIFEIAADLNRLQALGDQGMLPPNDLSGGTFALSNIGVIGGTYMTPLLVVPQVAIGALGALKKRGRYNSNDELVPTWIMEVSWSADHRVVDGVTMAKFSNLWKSYLENPVNMVMDLR